jgi:hypothetical protein
MDFLQSIINNFIHPPVLFFALGLIAVLLKSDLEIPPQIGKYLSLYLLFHIGILGGEELFHSGFSLTIIQVMLTCIAFSFFMPFPLYKILKFKLDTNNAGAIAATYGSISAVTFVTATSFLEAHHIHFDGYMVAGMALMESPAIIAGLIIVKFALNKTDKNSQTRMSKVFHEAFTNGSVLLLIGSMVIGYICGVSGEQELKPFVGDIFKGMLCLYMLDMGLIAGSKLSALKESGTFLSVFALAYPPLAAILGIIAAKLIGLDAGNALLLTILVASASYIAVPAAMRLAVPQANMSLLLPMALGLTFSLNVTLGIPLYYAIIERLWG